MRYLKILMIIVITLAAVSCDKCDNGTGPGDSQNIKEGWTHFSDGDYSLAVLVFEEALASQPSSVEAKVGKGWALLMKDTSATDEIVTLLENGKNNSDWEIDSRCALSALRLVRKEYDQAIQNADTLLAKKSSYVFEYKTDIDWKDVSIIKAQAHFLNQEYISAWNAVAGISDITLDPNNSSSWKINGKQYLSFAAALSSEIANLSDQYKSF